MPSVLASPATTASFATLATQVPVAALQLATIEYFASGYALYTDL